VDTFVAYNAVS